MENNVGKGEIACNKQFLLFSQCFLPNTVLYFNLDQSKILSCGNGLACDRIFKNLYLFSLNMCNSIIISSAEEGLGEFFVP